MRNIVFKKSLLLSALMGGTILTSGAHASGAMSEQADQPPAHAITAEQLR